MTLTLAFSLIVAVLAVPERELALALYRRWQGASASHRAIKISALCWHEALWWGWAISPLLPLSWPMLQASPTALAALVTLPVYVAGIAVWFTYHHDNGGPQGSLGPVRYGWAGYGYPWAYPFRTLISAVRLGGWQIVEPGGWTSIGELFLGAMTGRLTALILVAVHILALSLRG